MSCGRRRFVKCSYLGSITGEGGGDIPLEKNVFTCQFGLRPVQHKSPEQEKTKRSRVGREKCSVIFHQCDPAQHGAVVLQIQDGRDMKRVCVWGGATRCGYPEMLPLTDTLPQPDSFILESIVCQVALSAAAPLS